MNIPEKLKTWRSEKGLSQREAAEKIGESLRTWQEWEQGRRGPSGRALERLARIVAPERAEPVAFCQRLRNYRKQTCQSRSQAAQRLGVTRGWIADTEQERRVPRGAVMLRLLPFFQAAEENWRKLQEDIANAPKMKRSRRTKLKFATPLEWVEHVKMKIESFPLSVNFLSPGERRMTSAALQDELVQAKHALACHKTEERWKAKRLAERLNTRAPRRKSPVI